MDSERRHHLSQNMLGNWLVEQYEDVIKPNGQLIGWLSIAVLVILCGALLTLSMLKANSAKSWQQYFLAFSSGDPEASFQALVNSGSTGPAAAQSRLTFAQLLANDAERLLATDKKKGEEKLEKSLMMFQAAQNLANSDDVRRQALFGEAMAHEILAACRTGKNDIADAEKKYKEVADRWANHLYGRRAKQQLELLAKAETRAFYDFVAAAATEAPKDDDFKVDINIQDPFADGPTGFDPLKAIDGLNSMNPPPAPASETPKPADAPETE